MIAALFPRSNHRWIMQRLRVNEWRSVPKLGVKVGDGLLKTLVANGWIEQRGEGHTLEIKLTAAGLDAFRAKMPRPAART
jgi:chromosome segregation and condensation protein ScpB